MLRDNEVTIPKEFKFDMSKFVIEGRAKSTSSGSEVLDAASMTEDGQVPEDIFNNTVVTTYTPEEDAYSTQGKAYSRSTLNNSDKGIEVFQNLVIDNYLKMYIKLTSGFDVTEEIFPFQSGNLFFKGPDRNREEIFKKLKKELSESFPTRDVTSSINFDRLLGELTRSIILSPSKWANRTFYPKIFDRVFCVLIDEDSYGLESQWTGTSDYETGYDLDYVVDIETGEIDTDASVVSQNIATSNIDERNPTYYQFYSTASILSPMIDSQAEDEDDLTPEESASIASTVISPGYLLDTLSPNIAPWE